MLKDLIEKLKKFTGAISIFVERLGVTPQMLSKYKKQKKQTKRIIQVRKIGEQLLKELQENAKNL
jgi:predicted transcriptional regulator